jgi:peptide chain release factor 1
MAMDGIFMVKLENIKRAYDAMTERLADPDIANDRKQMLALSRERAANEQTVEAFEAWKTLENERLSLTQMDQETDDPELKALTREELSGILTKQEDLEKEITLLLLPKDPNDDRNVMLEVRAGTGGDEAGIFAGDLVNMYKKYATEQGWSVSPVSESEAELGGYKTCVLKITGDYVYSKLKYEVGFHVKHMECMLLRLT